MGQKDSKAFPITVDEATRRVTEAEKRRILDTYNRLTTVTNGLKKENFIRYVLGDGFPQSLGEAIYNICGGAGKSNGLNFKEVLTVLVLLTKGTKEEKVRFVFGLLSNDAHIERGEVARLLRDWEPDIDHNMIHDLFKEHDKVDFETFSKWLDAHPISLGVAEWLLQPPTSLVLASNQNTETTLTFYQTLAGVTHLEEHEITELEKRFWVLVGHSPSGRLDLSVIQPLVSPPMPPQLVTSFFSAFDENQDGHIDFKEMSCGVSAACRGPEMERQKFCFKIFDSDRDGVLNANELKVMCDSLIEVVKQTSLFNHVQESLDSINPEQILASKQGGELSGIRGQVLTLEEYLVWTVENPFPREFARLLFQLCHIVLGLRPSSRVDEGDIVRGWLEREEKTGMVIGSLWHLITMDWWQQWHSYVNHQDSPGNNSRNGSSSLDIRRGSRKTSSIDSNVASDADKSVIGTSYQPLTDVGKVHTVNGISNDYGSTSSRTSSCSASPHVSRKTSLVMTQTQAPNRPGPIDNSSLVLTNTYKVQSLTAEGGRLKNPGKLVRGKDYELIPERLWKALVVWYGGSPALPRQVIKTKAGEKELELNPLSLKIMKHQVFQRQTQATSMPPVVGGYSVISGSTSSSLSNVGASFPSTKRYHAYQAAFSRRTTIKQIMEFLTQRLRIKTEDIRLWHYKDDQHMEILQNETSVLEDYNMKDDDSLLVEVRSRDGTWPEEITSLYNNNERKLSLLNNQLVTTPGIIGLSNLGNTCYMNASVQCVANTKILSEYFKTNCHLHELNRTNPLGMKGHIAKRFGDLVRDMWSGDSRTMAPVRLKMTIGRYRQQFAGFQQQDSQELLAFLLDGLHEDLNRVTDKPYAELKDSDGRPDFEVAQEAWENHVLRNKSIIVDLFHGQLKSKVTCKVCSHESVRFDPFTYLSLPLPLERSVHIEIITIRQDGTLPVKYGITLDMDSKFICLKERLSELCHIPPQNLILVDIINSQFREISVVEQKLKSLNGSCIFAYEFFPLQNGTLSRSRESSEPPQSFSDIQRNTTKENGQNGVDNAKKSPKDLNKSVTAEVSSHTNDHKWTKNICMNGIVTCFKSEKDEDQGSAAIKIRKDPNEGDKVIVQEKTHVSSADDGNESVKSSDKAALLPNSPKMDCLSLPSANGGHSRQGSTTSHDSQGTVGSSSWPPTARSIGSQEEIADCQLGVIVALHRKMMPQENYFLSMEKYRPVLFGIPLIVGCSDKTTYRDMYMSVWKQVSRLVSPLPPRDSIYNHATDCDDSLHYEYPFKLTLVHRDGTRCSRCPWHRSCRGCVIPCDNTPFDFASSYLAIDWDQTALHLRYLAAQEKAFREDNSVPDSLRAASEPITLNKCLEAFTREEELGEDEKYYCTRCKKHQLAFKKLQIWRLPPILIVHLKRFHYLNNHWIKSHKIVDFPFYGLDPTEYLAAVPGETLKRYKSLRKHKRVSAFRVNGIIKEKNETKVLEDEIQEVIQEGDQEEVEIVTEDVPKRPIEVSRRRRMDSTSLVNTPISDDNLIDFHEHKLISGANPLDIKYTLYSFVCHSGVLSGGHYISYSKSKDSKWYCQNDSTCKEIPEEQLDKSTAYLLFYERDNLSLNEYMPKIKNGAAETEIKELEEELESEFKKQCSLM